GRGALPRRRLAARLTLELLAVGERVERVREGNEDRRVKGRHEQSAEQASLDQEQDGEEEGREHECPTSGARPGWCLRRAATTAARSGRGLRRLRLRRRCLRRDLDLVALVVDPDDLVLVTLLLRASPALLLRRHEPSMPRGSRRPGRG